MLVLKCALYKRVPRDIDEYIVSASEENMSADAYVRYEEGTYNPYFQLFWCTECYIKLGCPLGKAFERD